MVQFLADIVFVLELVAVAAGIYVYSIAKEKSSSLIKYSALLLIVGGIVMATCSSFFYVKYYLQGEFDSAAPGRGMMGNMMQGSMGPGMMRGGGWMDYKSMDPETQKRYQEMNQEVQEFHRKMMDKYGMLPRMMYGRGGMGPGMMQQGGGSGSDMMNDTK